VSPLRRWLLRAAAASVIVACVTGPAPGNVGGCGASNPVAPANEHCINERFWKCRRDLAGGRLNESEYMDCLAPIGPACQGAMWPAGCEPSNSQSAACITLLSRSDLVSTPTDVLLMNNDDCNLCL